MECSVEISTADRTKSAWLSSLLTNIIKRGLPTGEFQGKLRRWQGKSAGVPKDTICLSTNVQGIKPLSKTDVSKGSWHVCRDGLHIHKWKPHGISKTDGMP